MAFRKYKLSNNEAAGAGGITHIAVFDYTGINDNATSANQATLATIPVGGSVYYCGVIEQTALAGATNITLDVGTSTADPDEFINALDVDGMTVAVNNTGDAYTTDTYNKFGLGQATAETDIVAEWNGTTSDLTAGQVVIALGISDPLAAAGL